MLMFDIETESLPIEQLQLICEPFDRSTLKDPGTFSKSDVKTGNMTDPVKIQDKINDAEAKHAILVEKYREDCEQGEANHWAKVAERGALSALTGAVCAVGFQNQAGKQQLHIAHNGVNEATLIGTFWKTYKDMRAQNRNLVGWNIHGFDIPFLIQRSFILGISIPDDVLTATGYMSAHLIDLMKTWAVGVRPGFAKLDTVAKACGLSGKPTDCTGATFASMLRSGDETKVAAAINYLKQDLHLTAMLADRLGAS
jgi:hypothetical protein